MSESHISREGQAFEYVSGTLDASERAAYERKLENSADERALVKFWQEHLLSLDVHTRALAPADDTWSRIAAATGIEEKESPKDKRTTPGLVGWFGWATTAMATLVIAFLLIKPLDSFNGGAPNTDYIAVLTDTDGKAVLTALTTQHDSKMWLQWEALPQPEDVQDEESSLQLWAVSKRDGQIRSLAVFEDTSGRTLALNETAFRLVTDSSFLLLTREEVGGSAIDEPSEDLVARGVCVRFSADEV